MARWLLPGPSATSALTTYTVIGDDLQSLAEQLAGKPGVDMVAPFGTSLHVSGRDATALEAAIAPLRTDPRLRFERAEASLEDVFIDLMGRARDNFRDVA